MAWWRQAIIWTNVDLSSGYSPESNFIGITEDVFIWYEFANYHFKITTTSPRGQWVKSVTRVFTFMGSSVNSENIECKNQVSWSYRMLGTASTGISTGQKKVWGLKIFLTLCIMRHWLFCWFSDWLISLSSHGMHCWLTCDRWEYPPVFIHHWQSLCTGRNIHLHPIHWSDCDAILISIP